MVPTSAAPDHAPPRARRLVAAAFSGTAIEYYDFLAYAIAASTVFGQLFFPSSDEIVGTLFALGTFAAGFLMRPIGAVVIGHFGDKLGRKKMLVVTLLLMSVATVLIGVLPTYGQVGVAAPVLLILLRLVQGFAAGGEYGGAALMAVEHAPPHRRALYGSWPSFGTSIGGLLATVVFAVLDSTLSREAFLSWGWRIPFLASIVLLGVGFYVRARIPESPAFVAIRENAEREKLPLRVVLTRYPAVTALSAGTLIGLTSFTYLVFTFLVSYGTQEVGIDRGSLLIATMIGLGLLLVFMPASAALADRVGIRPVMLAGSAFLVVYPFVLFPLVETGSFPVVVLAVVIAYGGTTLAQAPVAALFAQQFPTAVRYSGVSVGYQVGNVLGGGISPLVATALFAASGKNVTVVAGYASAVALISGVCIFALRRPAAAIGQDEPAPASTPT